MKKFLVLIFLCSITKTAVYSQTAITREKPKFSTLQALQLFGNKKSGHVGFQLIAGANYKQFYAGIGASIDAYYTMSVPLFLDLRYTVYHKQLGIFVYNDLGVNTIVNYQNKYPKKNDNGDEFYHLQKGLYHDYGIGVKTKLAPNFWYHISIGFSYKESKYRVTQYYWNNQTPYVDSYFNKASRIMIKMGFQF